MAQPPYLLDVLQIEPGSGDTLTIARDSAAGAMKFVDAVLTSGVLLSALAGLRNVTGLFVVGRAGDGAPYTTIQSAVDAIPVSSSATAPSVVLILSGVYTENLTIQRDGVCLVGLGGVTIANSGASDTITVSAATDSTPQDALFRGLTVTNDQATQSCINILGADTFATATATVVNAPLATGDTLTIGGVALTGTAAARTSGSNDFWAGGGTVDAVAAEIVDAINDAANGFTAVATAVSALGVITLTAATAGSGGNATTLASLTTPAAGITLSGVTFAGGTSAGSMVGNGLITVEDCVLVASGAGGWQVKADTVGHIRVRGGTFRGSASNSLSQAANCASFRISGLEWTNDIQVAYDTTLDRPNDTACAYELTSLGRVRSILSNLSGIGTLTLRACSEVSTISQDGDQTLDVLHSTLGTLTLNTTTTATLRQSTRTTLTVAGGTPTLQEPLFMGSEAFAASATQTVTLPITQPDALYTVLLESPAATSVLAVTNKTTTTFDIEAAPALTGTVGYSVIRAL